MNSKLAIQFPDLLSIFFFQHCLPEQQFDELGNFELIKNIKGYKIKLLKAIVVLFILRSGLKCFCPVTAENYLFQDTSMPFVS